jgi:hypothetical protein
MSKGNFNLLFPSAHGIVQLLEMPFSPFPRGVSAAYPNIRHPKEYYIMDSCYLD